MENNSKKHKKYHLTLLGKIVFSLLGIFAAAVIVFCLRTALVTIENMMPIDKTLETFTQKALEGEITKLSPKQKRMDVRMCKNPNAYGQLFESKLLYILNEYAEGRSSYEKALRAFDTFKMLEYCADKADKYIENTQNVKQGRESLTLAKEYEDKGDIVNAVEQYLKVSPIDKSAFVTAQSSAKRLFDSAKPAIEQNLNGYLATYKLDKARQYANELSALFGEVAEEFTAKIDQYETFQNNVVDYSGPVEHVFTHCLIAFPELCYSSPAMTKALDTDCITPKEFTAILENLYQKDYILIDINLLYDEQNDKVAKLKLPAGKKPLVLSVDDVTYDSRKMHTGMVDKLIVDEKGNVCTYTLADGEEIISYENEVFPILNSFVRKHPDFTYKGARGTLCNTGFDGVFGYRTQSEPIGNEKGIDRQSEIEKAKIVAQSLKDEGWTFASHGFGHRHMAQITYELAKSDTDSWLREVVPILGETKVMVWPYGEHVRKGPVHEYLYEAGFRIFCGVGSKPYLAKEPDGLGIFMDRKALDGYSLRNRRDSYMYLFDTQQVWDELRPKEISW